MTVGSFHQHFSSFQASSSNHAHIQSPVQHLGIEGIQHSLLAALGEEKKWEKKSFKIPCHYHLIKAIARGHGFSRLELDSTNHILKILTNSMHTYHIRIYKGNSDPCNKSINCNQASIILTLAAQNIPLCFQIHQMTWLQMTMCTYIHHYQFE